MRWLVKEKTFIALVKPIEDKRDIVRKKEPPSYEIMKIYI